MEIEGITLLYLLKNPDTSAEFYGNLRASYFSEDYRKVFSLINKYHKFFGTLPSIDELLVYTRKDLYKKLILAIIDQELPEDIDSEVLLTALMEKAAQDRVLSELRGYLEDLEVYSVEETITKLHDVVFSLEKEFEARGSFHKGHNIKLNFDDEGSSDILALGVNNDWDATYPIARNNLVLIGGYRGSGKSVISTNIICNQFNQGNCPVYFTIEMSAEEAMQRIIAIMSGVSATSIRNNVLSESEKASVAKAICYQYKNEDELIGQFDGNLKTFQDICGEQGDPVDNPFNIIDERGITVEKIDSYLSTIHEEYEDKLKVVVVDYINKISTPNSQDQFDWKEQVNLSVELKKLAKKYNVALVTPMQLTAEGQLRFSKAIEDEADLSMVIEPGSDSIKLNSSKSRYSSSFSIESGIDWNTLKITPASPIGNFQGSNEIEDDDD